MDLAKISGAKKKKTNRYEKYRPFDHFRIFTTAGHVYNAEITSRIVMESLERITENEKGANLNE